MAIDVRGWLQFIAQLCVPIGDVSFKKALVKDVFTPPEEDLAPWTIDTVLQPPTPANLHGSGLTMHPRDLRIFMQVLSQLPYLRHLVLVDDSDFPCDTQVDRLMSLGRITLDES